MREDWGGVSSPPAGPTSDGHPLGEDGDSALGHLLEAQYGRTLGAPAVRAHPEEVASLVGPARRFQHPPVGTQQPNPGMHSCPAAPPSTPISQAVSGPSIHTLQPRTHACPYSQPRGYPTHHSLCSPSGYTLPPPRWLTVTAAVSALGLEFPSSLAHAYPRDYSDLSHPGLSP